MRTRSISSMQAAIVQLAIAGAAAQAFVRDGERASIRASMPITYYVPYRAPATPILRRRQRRPSRAEQTAPATWTGIVTNLAARNKRIRRQARNLAHQARGGYANR
ncbi:MAG: hypothetical protein ABIY70_08670 [Capsulimonas sp.]|uniref:hypothetical protein n=1 Tax=Capsulimonas sp. TaxID=2494211 RepID=UPI003264231B